MFSVNSLKRIRTKEFFVYIVMFLYSILFLQLNLFIQILFLFLSLGYLIKNKLSKQFTFMMVILIMFSITFSSISRIYFQEIGIGPIMQLFIGPSSFFIAGYFFSHKFENINNKPLIFNVFLLLSIGVSIHFFLSYIHTVRTFGSIRLAYQNFGWKRYILTFFTNHPLSATLVNLYLSLPLTMGILAFDKGIKISFFKKLVLIINFIISGFIIIQIGSRTGLLLIIMNIIIYSLTQARNTSKLLKLILYITVIIGTMVIFYYNNVFNIKEIVEKSSLFQRLMNEGFENSRFNTWKEVLSGMFSYPFGGRQIVITSTYSHNLWLDVALDAGIFPFLLLIIFSILSIKEIVTYMKYGENDFYKRMFLILYISFFSLFMFEPVLQGPIPYFTMYCLLVGSVRALNEKNVRKNYD